MWNTHCNSVKWYFYLKHDVLVEKLYSIFDIALFALGINWMETNWFYILYQNRIRWLKERSWIISEFVMSNKKESHFDEKLETCIRKVNCIIFVLMSTLKLRFYDFWFLLAMQLWEWPAQISSVYLAALRLLVDLIK